MRRKFVPFVYTTPIIYDSQQVVLNLFPYHHLDADVPPRGIERIAYFTAYQLRSLDRTNLCFFQSTKYLPSRRQELKASRRISGYAPITSLRISFGTPSIPGAVFAFNLPPALFSSSRVKSSSRRITQELRPCLWNRSTCGNKLRTMLLT